ncbi:MAG: SDR family oxidoreductase [Desulfobacteraceae bacterium]|nr:SDR family oxidoreductase [Desulfobacteraceae bacterium]
MRVKNKVAIVTGSAQGMGRAFALRLAKEGAKVTLCDILDCEPAAQEIAAAGGEALALKIDVTSEQDTVEMAKRTFEYFGSVDILINNAAIFGGIEMRSFDEIPAKEWDKIMAVNLKGVFLCSKAVVPYMKEQGKGKIVNIASGVAFSGLPLFLHYTTSKGGIVSLTRGLARELGEFGINVNAVAPGMVWTEATQAMVPKEFAQENVKKQCIKKIVQPEDVAAAVLFFASDESDLIAGQVLLVNGGEVLH